MSDPQLNNSMEHFAELWGKAVVDKRYGDAILIGSLAYSIFHEKKDATHEQAALSFISDAISFIGHKEQDQFVNAAKHDYPTCSFCLQSGPDLRLAAGPSAFICDSCAATVHKSLNTAG